MPTWDSDRYLRFARERTRPAEDLAARVELASPRRIIDLGCGPGNSTAVLARRWAGAEIVGLDSSPAMIASARRDYPSQTWIRGDIAAWTADPPCDLAFSNAALQWVPDHAAVVPRLLQQVRPGGALAFQVPANVEAPPHRLMREIAASRSWRGHFAEAPREWRAEPPAFYYDLLGSGVQRIDLWETEYIHVLESADDIVEWYRGTGLRPWLEALPNDVLRAQFVADYREAIAAVFSPRADGRVLFPFKRLFVVAYR